MPRWPRSSSPGRAGGARVAVTLEQLSDELADAGFTSGDMVYVARCGEEYLWYPVETVPTEPGSADSWIYYSGRWPTTPTDFPPFFEDLLAEMESMAGGADRCRWSLDDPWPHTH